MNQQLNLYLLGNVSVELNGRPVAGLPSRAAEALLIYLACHNRPISREVLADLLWRDRSQKRALANLRTILTSLRRKLGDYLVITRYTLAFNHAADYWLDTIEFEHQLAQLSPFIQSSTPLSAETVAQVEAALDLYQGDFLEGFYLREGRGFEEWTLLRRERLRHLACEALQLLVNHDVRVGAYQFGIKRAGRLLELDPLREGTHCQLMRLLALAGQRNAALKQYETCRAILATELGVAPAPETTTVYEHIRAARSAGQHNLPFQLTPFFGRQTELIEIAERLNQPSCRLLTLTGAGGTGKTRLAIQAATEQVGRFLNGVYFISLAAVSSTEFISSALADTLGFSLAGQKTPHQELLNFLSNKEMLLVFDNFEHLLAGAGLVFDILKQAPAVKILVTSRQRLNFQAEWVLEIRGLSYPADADDGDLKDYSAVQLFVERSRRVKAGFLLSEKSETAVTSICQLVEGMPLGIELAAALVSRYTCEQIAAHIEQNLDTLATTMRDVPARHRSVRVVFEHSWHLLSAEEQCVFQQLAVFRGGFEAQAAQAVAGAFPWILSALADKSLVYRVSETRYALHELLRQYAVEKLNEYSREKEEAQARHCQYYAAFVQQQANHLKKDQQKEALATMSVEIENVRAAWQQAVTRSRENALEKFLIGLYQFYDMRGWYQEALTVFSEAAASLETSFGSVDRLADRPAIILGNLLSRQGWFSYRLGHSEQAKAFLHQSLPILRRANAQWELATALNELGIVSYRSGEHIKAKQLYEESLAVSRKVGDRRRLAITLNNLGNVCRALGEYEQAREALQENLEIMRELGDQFSLANSLNNLGEVCRAQGKRVEAKQHYQESLALRREIGDQMGVAVSLNNLGSMAHTLGEYQEAVRLLQESLRIFNELNTGRERAYPLSILGRMARDLGNYRESLAYYQEALKLCMDAQNIPKALDILTEIAPLLASTGEKKKAVELLALVIHHSAGHKETRREADGLLSALKVELPLKVVAAAQEHGQRQELKEAVEDILRDQRHA